MIINKKISIMKYFSFVYIIILIYLILIYFITCNNFYNFSKDNYKISLFRSLNINSFDYLTSTLFSYFCHPSVFKFWKELHNPNKRRLMKTVNLSLYIELFIFIFFGIVSYLIFGDNEIEKIVILKIIPFKSIKIILL